MFPSRELLVSDPGLLLGLSSVSPRVPLPVERSCLSTCEECFRERKRLVLLQIPCCLFSAFCFGLAPGTRALDTAGSVRVRELTPVSESLNVAYLSCRGPTLCWWRHGIPVMTLFVSISVRNSSLNAGLKCCAWKPRGKSPMPHPPPGLNLSMESIP